MDKPELPTLLSAEESISLIGRFLTKEWKMLKPEDVSVTRLQSGFNNSVYAIVSKKALKMEPQKVIVRMYGGNYVQNKGEILSNLTEQEELILCCELGRRELGPKIYGIIPNGRVEEYIDSRPATRSDLMNPDFESDFAKNMARYHAVQVPFPKPKYNFAELLKEGQPKIKDSRDAMIANPVLEPVKEVYSHDWMKELEFLTPLLEEDRHRIVLMHWDTHLLNIGVRNNPLPGQLKSFLFDYEISCYNIRGKDIGLYFLSKIGLIGDKEYETPLEEIVFPSFEEVKHFLENYSKECSILFDDWDPKGIDSFDHIIMEALIGGMVSCIAFMMASIFSNKSFMEIGPNFVMFFARRLYHAYFECKKQLELRYPDYATTL